MEAHLGSFEPACCQSRSCRRLENSSRRSEGTHWFAYRCTSQDLHPGKANSRRSPNQTRAEARIHPGFQIENFDIGAHPLICPLIALSHFVTSPFPNTPAILSPPHDIDSPITSSP